MNSHRPCDPNEYHLQLISGNYIQIVPGWYYTREYDDLLEQLPEGWEVTAVGRYKERKFYECTQWVVGTESTKVIVRGGEYGLQIFAGIASGVSTVAVVELCRWIFGKIRERKKDIPWHPFHVSMTEKRADGTVITRSIHTMGHVDDRELERQLSESADELLRLPTSPVRNPGDAEAISKLTNTPKFSISTTIHKDNERMTIHTTEVAGKFDSDVLQALVKEHAMCLMRPEGDTSGTLNEKPLPSPKSPKTSED